MIYRETYDFKATSKDDAEKMMARLIKEHYLKYGKLLHIENLRPINRDLRRCNLSY